MNNPLTLSLSTAGSEDPPSSSVFSPVTKTDIFAKSSEDDPVSQAIAKMIEPEDEVRLVATHTTGDVFHILHDKSFQEILRKARQRQPLDMPMIHDIQCMHGTTKGVQANQANKGSCFAVIRVAVVSTCMHSCSARTPTFILCELHKLYIVP